jgi:hypothetical protein
VFVDRWEYMTQDFTVAILAGVLLFNAVAVLAP